MGSENQPAQSLSARKQEQQQIRTYSHPRFADAKEHKFREHDGNYCEVKCSVPSVSVYKLWEKRVSQIRERFKDNSLLLPFESVFEQEGICGSAGIIKMKFESYPYILEQEIQNRKIQNLEFSDHETWFSLYILLKTTALAHREGIVLGDIRPTNVFISQEGQIALFNSFTFPEELNNFQKSLYEHQVTYLPPEAIDTLKKGGQKTEYDAKLAESFSIGLTLLDLILLSDSSVLYDKNDYNFDILALEGLVSRVEKSSIDPKIKEIVQLLLRPDPQQRASCIEIYEYLLPYEQKINEFEEFQVTEPLSSHGGSDKRHRGSKQSSPQNSKYVPIGKSSGKKLSGQEPFNLTQVQNVESENVSPFYHKPEQTQNNAVEQFKFKQNQGQTHSNPSQPWNLPTTDQRQENYVSGSSNQDSSKHAQYDSNAFSAQYKNTHIIESQVNKVVSPNFKFNTHHEDRGESQQRSSLPNRVFQGNFTNQYPNVAQNILNAQSKKSKHGVSLTQSPHKMDETPTIRHNNNGKVGYEKTEAPAQRLPEPLSPPQTGLQSNPSFGPTKIPETTSVYRTGNLFQMGRRTDSIGAPGTHHKLQNQPITYQTGAPGLNSEKSGESWKISQPSIHKQEFPSFSNTYQQQSEKNHSVAELKDLNTGDYSDFLANIDRQLEQSRKLFPGESSRSSLQ